MVRAHKCVYIACPANFATGGPELLHQLGIELRNIGINVFMYYLGFNQTKYESPVHDNYKTYSLPFVCEIEDLSSNLLILSETALNEIVNYKFLDCVIWWLSVDNVYVNFDLINQIYNSSSILNRVFCKMFKYLTLIPVFRCLYQKYPKFRVNGLINLTRKSSRFEHWAQSHYAIEFIKSKGIEKVEYISDYLRLEFIHQAQKVDISKKQEVIAYNPKKGLEFTQQIIQATAGTIQFIPIIDMTIDEVKELLSVAKIYIDFGCHPGKDRIPREAAMLGCCVVTGLEGSARFNEDLPIPIEYKFVRDASEVPNIVAKLRFILANYESCLRDFMQYKEFIMHEQGLFVDSVGKLFGEECAERINCNSSI